MQGSNAAEVRACFGALARLLDATAERARVTANYKDGELVLPLTICEFRIPPARIEQLIADRDFNVQGDLYVALADLARPLQLHAGETSLTVEFEHQRARWLDRTFQIT